MAFYVDKNNKDPDAKNEMSSQAKYNLEDKIAKRRLAKDLKRILTKLRTIF